MDLFETIESRNRSYRHHVNKNLPKKKISKKFRVFLIFINVFLLLIIFFEAYAFYNFKEIDVKAAKIRDKQLTERIANRKKIITEEVRKSAKAIPVKDGQKRVTDIYRSGKKVAYLTYDDGPSKKITPPLLDYLEKEKIPVTFFPLGYRVELYPDIIKRMEKDGHYIASHGNSHNYSKIYKDVAATIKDIVLAENSTKKVLGNDYVTTLYRFPGGSVGGYYAGVKRAVKKELKKRNIAYVDWNVLTGDAAGNRSVESQFNEFKKTKGHQKALIVLMHDNDDKKYTLDTTKKIVPLLRSEGYTFKNFTDIFKPKEEDIQAEIDKRMNEYLSLPSEKIKEIEENTKKAA